MLNKKGLSLAELIVAVALISVVMVFLYNLLSDIKNEISNSDFAINNQLNRFEIIDLVQSDMQDETITSILLVTSNQLKIVYTNSKYTLIKTDYDNNTITVTNKDGLNTMWIMDSDCFIGDIYHETDTFSSGKNNYYISIPIYTTNEKNITTDSNNVLDDLEFFHINP